MKYSEDGVVRFDPVSHTYWRGSKRLKGVTSLIKKFVTPFDGPLMAERYAKKHGGNAADILAAWELKGKISREEGSAIHTVFENYCDFGNMSYDRDRPKQVAAVKFIVDYFISGRLTPIAWEQVVYGENVASMIDNVSKNKDDELFILDWKSNKEIKKDGYGRTMYPPFDAYPDASFYHYSVQVCIYKKLFGRNVKGLYIVHITENGYELIKAEDIFIPDYIL